MTKRKYEEPLIVFEPTLNSVKRNFVGTPTLLRYMPSHRTMTENDKKYLKEYRNNMDNDDRKKEASVRFFFVLFYGPTSMVLLPISTRACGESFLTSRASRLLSGYEVDSTSP